MYQSLKQCRICGNQNLTEVLNFGEQYLASSFVESNEHNELANIRIPLTAVLCDRSKNASACGLLQLKETVDRDQMYRRYFYRSATNPMMRDALKEIADATIKKVSLVKGDTVLDIGANDGTMLEFFPSWAERIGIDPAKNINRADLDKSITIIEDYFSKDRVIKASPGKLFKVITSIAMFYDLDDPNSFVAEVKSILAPDGIWCIQLSYLPATLMALNFYDVCHEHLLYYSLRTLSHLLERHQLGVFDASLNDVNGGSLRVFVGHASASRPITPAVKKIYAEEDKMMLSNPATYRKFTKQINSLKKITLDLIRSEKENGGSVIGLGASTKGNMLLQFFGIDKTLIPYLSERNPEKVGLRTLGTDIELISEERARDLNPSAMLVLIWFFKNELIKREQAYLRQGGKLYFPMPYPHVVTKDGEIKLG